MRKSAAAIAVIAALASCASETQQTDAPSSVVQQTTSVVDTLDRIEPPAIPDLAD